MIHAGILLVLAIILGVVGEVRYRRGEKGTGVLIYVAAVVVWAASVYVALEA